MSSKSWETAIRTSASNFSRELLGWATEHLVWTDKRLANRGNGEGEAASPNMARLKFDGPHGENLRALIDALETLLGFGDGLDGRDPVITCLRGLDGYVDFLPFIDEAQLRRGRGAGPTQGVPFARYFDVT